MTEWGVVTVMVTLIGLIGVFVKITSIYEKTTTKLTVTIENLQKCIDEMKESKDKNNDRIYCKLQDHDEDLAEHETRITLLEKEKQK